MTYGLDYFVKERNEVSDANSHSSLYHKVATDSHSNYDAFKHQRNLANNTRGWEGGEG